MRAEFDFGRNILRVIWVRTMGVFGCLARTLVRLA